MSQSTRYHGLDAARAIALLLGVSLHASCSFIPYISGWAAMDVAATPAMAVFFDVIHMFRMALFFLMAGFLAHLALERKGRDAFIRDRFERIVLPLVGGWIAVYPLIVWVWIWSAKRGGSGLVLPPEIVHLPAIVLTIGGFLNGKIFQEGVILMHFWFLYYLALCYGAILLADRFGRSSFLQVGAAPRVDRCLRRVIERPWGVLVLAAPVAAVLILQRTGVGLAAQESIPPLLRWSFLGYFWVFVSGWLIFRQPDLLEAIERGSKRNLCVAAALTVPLTAHTLMLGKEALDHVPEAALERIVYSAGYAVALWSWTLGLTGVCLRRFARPSRMWRYVADSSYWIYLTHLPLVAFVQVAIADLRWHWLLKFALIHAIVLPPLFWSYHYWVRPTWIGAILNGRRRGRRAEIERGTPEAATAAAGAVPRV